MMTKGLTCPVLLCLIAVAFLVTRADADRQQASAIKAKGWPQERKIVKSISIPLSDASPGFDPVKGSGDIITIAGITDVGDASPATEVSASPCQHFTHSHANTANAFYVPRGAFWEACLTPMYSRSLPVLNHPDTGA